MTIQNDDDVRRLAEIRAIVKGEESTGRWWWDQFTCDDVEFLLRLIDGSVSDT